MMPMLVDRGFLSEAMAARADELISLVGLQNVKNNLALNMSGGQQQRVAVARALAMNPDLVLADEPTGNLDTKSANGVFDLMREVNRSSGASSCSSPTTWISRGVATASSNSSTAESETDGANLKTCRAIPSALPFDLARPRISKGKFLPAPHAEAPTTPSLRTRCTFDRILTRQSHSRPRVDLAQVGLGTSNSRRGPACIRAHGITEPYAFDRQTESRRRREWACVRMGCRLAIDDIEIAQGRGG